MAPVNYVAMLSALPQCAPPPELRHALSRRLPARGTGSRQLSGSVSIGVAGGHATGGGRLLELGDAARRTHRSLMDGRLRGRQIGSGLKNNKLIPYKYVVCVDINAPFVILKRLQYQGEN